VSVQFAAPGAFVSVHPKIRLGYVTDEGDPMATQRAQREFLKKVRSEAIQMAEERGHRARGGWLVALLRGDWRRELSPPIVAQMEAKLTEMGGGHVAMVGVWDMAELTEEG